MSDLLSTELKKYSGTGKEIRIYYKSGESDAGIITDIDDKFIRLDCQCSDETGKGYKTIITLIENLTDFVVSYDYSKIEVSENPATVVESPETHLPIAAYQELVEKYGFMMTLKELLEIPMSKRLQVIRDFVNGNI